MEPVQPSSVAASMMSSKYPLAKVVDRWVKVIKDSEKAKHEEFGQWADEAMQFFDGPLNWMWDQSKSSSKDSANGFLDSGEGAYRPTFLMSVNRLFEAVSMFGPVLYHQNPTIAVTPRRYPAVAMETMYASSPEALQMIQMIPQVNEGLVLDRTTIDLLSQLQMQYQSMVGSQEQQQIAREDHASILEHYANWLQQEGDKKSEARHAITETIITGLGLMEIVPDTSPGSDRTIPRARYRSGKDLFVDPDAKYWRDVTWIALKTCAPVNIVERKFGLPPGSIKGQYASATASAGKNVRSQPKNGNGKPAGISHDIIEYWEVYSKNGAGQNLKTPNSGKENIPAFLNEIGDFVYLAVSKDVTFPLNLGPEVMQMAAQLDEQAAQIQEQMMILEASGQSIEGMEQPQTGMDLLIEQASWQVPYWSDHYSDGGWPVVRLSFYNKPGQVWPISMCKSCIGELRFVNWCMSFLADGVAAGSKTYVAVMKEAASQIKDQLLNSTGPFAMIELEKIVNKPINELIQFLQAPSFNVDIWRMVAEVNETIDKRLGLTELVYGLSSKQMRSAAEAQYRQQNINVRPDDMASRVEDWLSLVATREIQAMRWSCEFDDVLPVLGEMASHVYQTQILSADVESITRDFSFRVQAGTARKPSKDTRIAQLNDLAQYLLPNLTPLAQSGIVGPLNAFISDMADAMEMDASKYLLSAEDAQQLFALAAPEPKEASPNNEEG